MTQREAFEAWAKSLSLDTDHKEKDGWGREQYSPHIRSMWEGWQAAQAQAAVAPVKRPVNCGTGFCSCVECVMEPEISIVRGKAHYTPPDQAAAMHYDDMKQDIQVMQRTVDAAREAMRLALECIYDHHHGKYLGPDSKAQREAAIAALEEKLK